jgi:hypothetical protein
MSLLAPLLLLAPFQFAGMPAPERPRDPHVLTCALDGQPETLVVALHDDMWVAYDIRRGALVRAWKGGASPAEDGGLTSDGAAFLEGTPEELVWELDLGDGPQRVEPTWTGYEFRGNTIQLKWSFPGPDGGLVEVIEMPDLEGDPKNLGRPTLRRYMRTSGIPQGGSLALVLDSGTLRSLADDFKATVTSEDDWKLLVREEVETAWGGRMVEARGRLVLMRNGFTRLYHHFPVELLAVALADTPVPTAAAEAAPARAEIDVLRAPARPALDGTLDDAWHAAPTHPLTHEVAGSRDGAGDASAEYRALYDDEHLYLLVTVVDDVHTADSDRPFHDDAVAVYVDAGAQARDHYDADDVQYVFRPDGERPFTSSLGEAAEGVRSGVRTVDGGWSIAIAIPWSSLGVTEPAGRELGLEVQLEDDDPRAPPTPGATRGRSGARA